MIPRLFKNFSIVFVGTNFESFLRFVLHIYIAQSLGLRLYGHYVLIISIVNYARVANLGTIDGMRRQIPYYLGAQSHDRVAAIKSLAFFTALIMPLISALIVWLLFQDLFWPFILHSEKELVMAWAMAVLIFIFSSVFDYFPGVMVATKRFKESVFLRNSLACVALLLAIPGARYFGLAGCMGAWLVSYGLNTVLGLMKEGMPHFKLDFKEMKILLSVGLPLMLISILDGLYINVDKFMIGYYLGSTQVGYYGIAVLILYFLGALSIAAGVIYPDMSERFGQKDDPKSIEEFFWQPVFSLGILIPFVLPVIYGLVQFLLSEMWPAYGQSLPAAKVMVLGAFFFMLVPFAGFALISIGQQVWFMAITGINLVLAAVLCWSAITFGFGIFGVAVATILTFVFSNASMMILLMRRMSYPWAQILNRFLKLHAGYILMLLLIVISEIIRAKFSFTSPYFVFIMLALIEIILILFTCAFRPYCQHLLYLRKMVFHKV